MKKVWVVVANSSLSKIYRNEGNVLVEYKTMEHPESRLKRDELVSDKPGRMPQRAGYGMDTMNERTSPKVTEAKIFAREIAEILVARYNSGECDRIYLIMSPPFSAYVRENLSKAVDKIVETEIHKDLTHLRPEEIRAYLPPVL